MQRLDAYNVYLVISAVSPFAFALAFTTSAVYRYETAGLDPLQLVLLGTALEASVFLFEIPTGIVADVYSRRLSVVIGYAIIGSGLILEGAFPLFTTILLAQIIWGIGYTFISGAQDAWLADELGEEKLPAIYLRGTQIAQIAALSGIGLNILLANYRINLPFIAGGFSHILLALFLILFMPEGGFSPAPREERDNWQNLSRTFRDGMQAIRIRPLLITILAITFIYGLYSEALDRFWQPQFLENVSFPDFGGLSAISWFGIINAAILMITVGTAELVRRQTRTMGPQQMTRLLAIMSSGISTGLILFGLARNFPIALASYASVATLRSTLNPLYSAWTNRGIPSSVRATVLSTLGQMDAIGQVLGGPALGLIANQFGFRIALITAGVILSPVLLLYRRAYGQVMAGTVTDPDNGQGTRY
jgi:DHA3 family tetracycline resistance protein-like MFS transporter